MLRFVQTRFHRKSAKIAPTFQQADRLKRSALKHQLDYQLNRRISL